MANSRKKFVQKQKLFLGALGVVVIAIVVYLMSVVVVDSNSDGFVEGEHYIVLDQPRRVRGEKIEVMEFFSYGCIHCYNFDEEVHDWAKARADKVKFVQTPAVANELWRNYGRAYYTMEQHNMLEANHTKMFQFIHDARRNLQTVDDFASVLANDEITAETFRRTFESNAVSQKINRADQMARQARVSTVPSLVVHGKYHVRVNGAIGFSRMLDVADFLIEKELAARQGAAPEAAPEASPEAN